MTERISLDDLWRKYGLDIQFPAERTLHELVEVAAAHTLVVGYLQRHSDLASNYRADQSGAIKYFDVLDLAEREIGLQRFGKKG